MDRQQIFINETVEDEARACQIYLDITADPQGPSPSTHFTVARVICAIIASSGNAFVISVFCATPNLRSTRNYYIISLAGADFLSGILASPFSLAISFGYPRNFVGCLFAVSCIMFLSAVSIYGIVAVAFDRYLATSDPFAYYRLIHPPTAIGICVMYWGFGGIIAFLPLFGWHNPYRENCFNITKFCYFMNVIHGTYLQFFYVFNVIFLTLLLIGFYGGIYRIILTKMEEEKTIGENESDTTKRKICRRSRSFDSSYNCDPAQHKSCGWVFGFAFFDVARLRGKEVRAARKVGFIILIFVLCWLPSTIVVLFYTFHPKPVTMTDIWQWAVILSRANSALNPFLYACHLLEFRIAMKAVLNKLFSPLFKLRQQIRTRKVPEPRRQPVDIPYTN